ncbi:MAG: hypothetical protein KAU49_01255 [Candidatus Krumholzibacteria bacterium]|nr:hypothetical protein [Candidatus Krumholzibacteria bacterium]
MVKGLDLFREHFRGYTDRYLLIGGTACDLAMDEVGLEFRATKDLDIVLSIEALDKEFVEAFWTFIRDGKYKVQEKSTGGKQYYRFQKPETEGYPFMLELFSRKPDVLSLYDDSHLTPIPVGKDVSSLSAILLSDDYYDFLCAGRRESDGLAFVGAEHLVPLKARAWLDLSERKSRGEDVDNRSIRNHKNDVFRLYRILSPGFDADVPDNVKDDMREFLSCMEEEEIDFKALGLGIMDRQSVLADIRKIYAIAEA